MTNQKYDYTIRSFMLDISDLEMFKIAPREEKSGFLNQIFNEVGF